MSDAVYEPSYEPYEGERTSRASRVGTIARRGLSRMARSTWFWVLLGLSLAHVAIRGGVLYVTGQVDLPEGTVPPQARDQVNFTANFLSNVLATQARWVVTFVLVVVGADAIAEDLEAGGLSFYFTKPITEPGYLAGKLAAPFTACMLVTALPVLLVWLFGVAFTPEPLYPDQVWLLPLLLLAASIVVSAMTTLVVAALSALLGSDTRASVVWVGLVVVLALASQAALAATGTPAMQTGEEPAAQMLVDPYNALDRVSQTIVGGEPAMEHPPALGAWLTVAGWSLAGLAGLGWGLHRQEVA